LLLQVALRDLADDPDYVAAHAGSNKKKPKPKRIPRSPDETPEERIAAASEEIRQAVGEDLLERVLGTSPESFEQLVVDLIVKMGYGGYGRTRASGLAVQATAASTALSR